MENEQEGAMFTALEGEKLELEEVDILKEEAKVEGWDYDKAVAGAEEREVKEEENVEDPQEDGEDENGA